MIFPSLALALTLQAPAASRDTTIVQHGPRDLEFRVTLAPLPRRVGDIVRVLVSVRNLGPTPEVVRLGPCYLTLSGVRPRPWPGDRDVCAAGSAEFRLAQGELWGLTEAYEFSVPPGRYPLRVQVAQDPEVWLGTDLILEAPSRDQWSGCLTADGGRAKARLGLLKDLMSSSDSDHVAAREVLGLRVIGPAEVMLVAGQEDCEPAVKALNALRWEPGTFRQVWLYRLGMEGYAVDDPSLDVGYADTILYFFGPDFEYKGTESGF
jgi:hypothetical protein